MAAVLLAASALPGCMPGAADRRPLAPRPVATGPYEVGAYYFPGWTSRTKWAQLDAFPERVPLLGYYREGHPEVMDWHIRWAVEHGIGFFVFDWYWDRGRRQLEHALHDGYLRARWRSALKFCLLWANHNPPGSHSEADLLALVDHWLAHYFRRPEYYTVDGKPMVVVFAPGNLRNDMGTEGVRAAIARMRERARAAGLPGLFLVGAVDADPAAARALRAEGYDAASGYNYPRAGMEDPEAREAPYALAVPGYERIWRAVADAGVIDYVPVTDPGWDSRPWDGARALVRTGRTPALFADMLRRARHFVDRNPVAGGRRIVLIEAWNEFGEGAVIEPHRQWGFAYLEAVREVFARDPDPHRDLTPADLGVPVPQAEP